MKISVVIPAYNREKTIRNTLESVLSQTSLPLEIIVIDDCSVDNTVKIVKSMKKKSSLIRLICLKKNKGAQAARNVGIKVAKGEWIAFLDSDDEWPREKIEIFQRVYHEHPEYDIYYSDYYEKKDGKMRYKNCRMPNKNGDYLKSILFGSKVLFQSMIVRKQALVEINYLDEKVVAYQEKDTNIRLAVNHRYYYINKPLFIYNIYDGETISKDKKKGIKGYQYIIKSNVDIYFNCDAYAAIEMYYRGSAKLYGNNNQTIKKNIYGCMEKIMCLINRIPKIRELNVLLHRVKWKRDKITKY